MCGVAQHTLEGAHSHKVTIQSFSWYTHLNQTPDEC